MNVGVLLGFLAYGAMAWGDAVIKTVGAERLSVFEIGFFVSVFAGIAMLFMRPKGERWRDLFNVRHPWLVALRSLSGIGAGIFGVIAFTGAVMATHYVSPTMPELGLMLISGGFAALGQFALLLAARLAPANVLGQAQYSQLFWAIAAGALFFAEYPDLLAIAGVAVIVVAGLLTLTMRRAEA